ncbi:MAG: CYTH domain-containing protein [Candidatus Krumholzibacteriia bacterium]
MRERELKFDLGDEAATARLEALLGEPVAGRLQVNRFFDAADGRLRRQLWALRLRGGWEVGGAVGLASGGEPPGRPPDQVILSLKGAREGSGAFHDRREEQVAPPAGFWGRGELAAGDLPAAWRALVPALPERLAEFARFTNLRRAYRLTAAWRAEVDRTLFGDGRRAWELEVEIGGGDDPEAARAVAEALLGRAGVAVRPQGKSKLERALGPA